MTETTGGNTTRPAQPTTLPVVLSITSAGPALVDPAAAELWCCLRDHFDIAATAAMFDAVAMSTQTMN